jgi:hypothetical protein
MRPSATMIVRAVGADEQASRRKLLRKLARLEEHEPY